MVVIDIKFSIEYQAAGNKYPISGILYLVSCILYPVSSIKYHKIRSLIPYLYYHDYNLPIGAVYTHIRQTHLTVNIPLPTLHSRQRF